MIRLLCSLVISFMLLSGPAVFAASNVDQAKQLFQKFQALEGSFNPAVADLYADHAVIEIKREYPNGQAQTMKLTGKAYKAMIRAAMPASKAAGDKSVYSNVSYKPQGNVVLISAKVTTSKSKFSGPYSLLVGPDKTGKWLILKEQAVTKP